MNDVFLKSIIDGLSGALGATVGIMTIGSMPTWVHVAGYAVLIASLRWVLIARVRP